MKHKSKMEEDVKVLLRLPRRIVRDLDVQVKKNPRFVSRSHAIRLAITEMLQAKDRAAQKV